MIKGCRNCGGLYTTESMEFFAGTLCKCPTPNAEPNKYIRFDQAAAQPEFITTPPDFTEQARQLVKHISDAAIELAFVRHGLTSDEVDVDEDTPPRIYAELHDDYCERIKEDTLACLTGDDTGCLDPEELDESNCELLWTQSLLTQVASEAATQGQASGIEQAKVVALGFEARYKGSVEHYRSDSTDRSVQERFQAIRDIADAKATTAYAIACDIERLSPLLDYLNRVRNGAATAALEQERERILDAIIAIPVTQPVEDFAEARDVWDYKADVLAAIGDDNERGNRD